MGAHPVIEKLLPKSKHPFEIFKEWDDAFRRATSFQGKYNPVLSLMDDDVEVLSFEEYFKRISKPQPVIV